MPAYRLSFLPPLQETDAPLGWVVVPQFLFGKLGLNSDEDLENPAVFLPGSKKGVSGKKKVLKYRKTVGRQHKWTWVGKQAVPQTIGFASSAKGYKRYGIVDESWTTGQTSRKKRSLLPLYGEDQTNLFRF